jgi:hypothetical protein
VQIGLAHQLEVWRVGESRGQQARALVGDDVTATVPAGDTARNKPPAFILRSEFDVGGRAPANGAPGLD